MPISQRFAIPTNDDDFEKMCLELLWRHWSRPGLEIFGKRGERQFGIDILDVSGETPVYAAQSKLKEEHKSLPPAEIQTEVDEAKKFTPPLGKYAILTTGKVSTKSQRKVWEINQAHKIAGLFEVEVLTWEHLCSLLQHYQEVQEQFYGDIGIKQSKRMEAQLLTIRDGVQSLTSRVAGSEVDSEINDARDCITRKEFQLATFLLNLIQRKRDDLTARQKFRVLSNHGAAALGMGKPDVAAKFFLEAVSYQPDDQQAKTNEVLAYLLVGDITTCHAKATALRQQFPASPRLAALWVTTAPKEVPLRELESAEISSVLRSDAEVSLAFARRALAGLDFDKALAYAGAARNSAPDDAHVLLALAQVRVACGQVDEGITFLSRAYALHSGSDIAFVYGKALLDRGREGDIENALQVLRKISVSDLRSEIRHSVVTSVIQGLAKQKKWSEANTYLDEVSEFLDPVVSRIIRGYLAQYQECKQEAERYASEARSLLGSHTSPGTKEFLARLLMLVGRPSEALPLWQDLFELDAPGFDPGNLLNCAARLNRDDVVLQACDRLHARGVNKWDLLEFEIPYLQKYNMDAAIERLQAFVNDHPDHKLAKLRLSVIGLLLNKPELMQARPEHLPTVSELPLEDAVLAVQVMKFGGDPTAAVDYAYRFLRKNFGAIQAHQALLISMMPGDHSPNIPSTLELVGPDAAVCYQEVPSGDLKWVVLEDTNSPDGDFEEIPVSSPLATELIGKKMEDTAVIARGTMQDRKATIVQILPKYVRRYQDSMGEMQVRFGAASPVESVRFGGPEDVGGEKVLDGLLASVKQRADAVESIREAYKTTPVSLHLYGASLGRNACAAIVDLAQAQDQPVKCSLGTPEERNQALLSLQTAKALVVDITALVTLRMLGLTKILSSTRYKFIVSQRTRITFYEMLAEAKMLSAQGGTLTFEGGRPLMYEVTAEERERKNREDEEFIRFVEKETELRSGVALAALQPTKREVLENVFGQYGAESIAIASDPDYVLWTDDLIQAQLSAHDCGVRRVWTQLVLGTLADAGLVTPTEYSEASARLIGMEYIATSFDASTMLAGIRLAGWSTLPRPAAQFVKVFSDPSTDLQGLLGIFISFVETLFREAIPATSRCAIVRSFLDALASKPQAITSLRGLRQSSGRVFGLNVIGQKQFEECFDLWLNYRGKPLILPA